MKYYRTWVVTATAQYNLIYLYRLTVLSYTLVAKTIAHCGLQKVSENL